MHYEPQELSNYLSAFSNDFLNWILLGAIHILSQRLLDLRYPDYCLSIPIEELPLFTTFNLLTVKEVIQYGFDRLRI